MWNSDYSDTDIYTPLRISNDNVGSIWIIFRKQFQFHAGYTRRAYTIGKIYNGVRFESVMSGYRKFVGSTIGWLVVRRDGLLGIVVFNGRWLDHIVGFVNGDYTVHEES